MSVPLTSQLGGQRRATSQVGGLHACTFDLPIGRSKACHLLDKMPRYVNLLGKSVPFLLEKRIMLESCWDRVGIMLGSCCHHAALILPHKLQYVWFLGSRNLSNVGVEF